MKKALIFYGGWNGHTPCETANVFKSMLEQNGYDVTLSDILEILDKYENIEAFDLFVPMWTMGEITPEQSKNICAAVRCSIWILIISPPSSA